MPFAPDQKEEIRSRLDIVQVISEYLTVKKVGTRFVASCPFHHEKTPSFSISPDNQFWYCFGCGEGGDIFKFVMQMEGLEFPDALRLLAKRAGVELRDEDAGKSTERQRLFDLNRLAARFWNELLVNNKAGERARAYAERRQLSPTTIEAWLIGYAPDSWDSTLNFLKARGFTDEELLKGGLALKSDRTGKLFDRFRGRLMFPICDVHGNIVGFTGRVLPGPAGRDPEKEPKYMNTPQTLVYDKSRVVFGLDKARQAVRQAGLAVLVEGNMDVVASHQAGVANVVASSGTALTEEHLRLLKRYADRLVLAFDVDVAGENASRRGVGLAMAAGFAVRVLTLPPDAGKDADDAIRKDPAIWQKAIEDAVPYLEWFIGKVKARTDMNDPEAKRRASEDLIREVAKVPQPVERSHWVRQLAELFRTPEELLQAAVEKAAAQGPARAERVVSESDPEAKSEPILVRPRDRHQFISENVLALAYRWPELMPTVAAELEPEDLDSSYVSLYTALILAYNKLRTGEATSPDQVVLAEASLSNIPKERIAVLKLLAEKEYDTLSGDARRKAVVRLIGELKELHKVRQRRELIETMVAAERRGDQEAIEKIQEQLNELSA